jgi:hypothetical protein
MQSQSAVAPVTVTPAASHTRRWLKKTYRNEIGCRTVPAAVLTDMAAEIGAQALTRENPAVASANPATLACSDSHRNAARQKATELGAWAWRCNGHALFFAFWGSAACRYCATSYLF